MRPPEAPAPAEIQHAPELAALYALDTTLETARRALALADPCLLDPHPHLRDHPSPRLHLGATLVAVASALQHTLRGHRHAAQDERAERAAAANAALDDIAL